METSRMDYEDMLRLVKKQEFKVWTYPSLPNTTTDPRIEKLQLAVDFGIYLDLYGNLGICACVRA